MTTVAPSPTRSRRWFQFRLRTLFVCLTLASLLFAWAAYSFRWMNMRKEAFDCQIVWIPESSLFRDIPRAPFGLWVLGEEGYRMLDWNSRSDVRLDEVDRLFPEAAIVDGVLLPISPQDGQASMPSPR